MSQIQALIEKARRYLRSTELLIHDGDRLRCFAVILCDVLFGPSSAA
jgi:hypothetical protein